MSKTSRRAILAGSATLPALAVPAVAVRVSEQGHLTIPKATV